MARRKKVPTIPPAEIEAGDHAKVKGGRHWMYLRSPLSGEADGFWGVHEKGWVQPIRRSDIARVGRTVLSSRGHAVVKEVARVKQVE